ncbi:hypothetical protein [Cohnella hashimotonis]|uniref:Uncharacterized protein n=1 Tax=Cohnella hashimotonis TaxID=2826895 RepID=A0ABT6TGB4_9BACL|nr:hypothetical protein [Cohnella hashimotonis]MDI4645866.1 hypothetical protein [Cohnella hashimotonis]
MAKTPMLFILAICLMVVVFFGYTLSIRESEPAIQPNITVVPASNATANTLLVNPGGPAIKEVQPTASNTK